MNQSKKTYYDSLAFKVLEILSNEDDGKMLLSEVMDALEEREGKNIPPELRELTRNGDAKWENGTKFATNKFVVVNYMKKGKGVWRILPEGEEALKKGEEAVIREANSVERNILADRRRKKKAQYESAVGGAENIDSGDADEDVDEAGINLDDYESIAKTSIKEHIHSLGPYDFQDLCAALLRGMGYHVRDTASPGPDGGIDIIAYNDPLGSKTPRIKVQVKHYRANENETNKSKVGRPEVDKLSGLLVEGDIGVLMTSSSFTAECERAARDKNKHIELIDFDRFIELWVEHYENLSAEDKRLLPLQPIYFLSKKES